MAFPAELKNEVEQYAALTLGSDQWFEEFFSFLSDPVLGQRLAEEFHSTRYIYKMLEGLQPTDWLLRAQVRVQVLLYASIYEAVIHHVLFVDLATDPRVLALTEYEMLKRVSIPNAKLDTLRSALVHDGKDIIPCFEGPTSGSPQKVRFDSKAACAVDIGLISESMGAELIEFYEARNAIHIHAEIRKDIKYELELSKRMYKRLQPFTSALKNWLESNNPVP